MKILILNSIVVLLLTIAQTFAHAAITDSDIENHSSMLFREFLDIAKSPSAEMMKRGQNGPYSFNGVRVAASCSAFLNGEEEMGPYGRITQEELTSNTSDYARMMNPNALGSYCPNFKNLNSNGRAFIWTVILTAMAHFESSCDSDVTAVGPNGTLRGLFQLHQGSEAGYDGSDNECIRNASYSEESSIKCALSMIDLQFAKRGSLFSNKSYWEVLRPNGRSQRADDIQRALRNSSMCSAG